MSLGAEVIVGFKFLKGSHKAMKHFFFAAILQKKKIPGPKSGSDIFGQFLKKTHFGTKLENWFCVPWLLPVFAFDRVVVSLPCHCALAFRQLMAKVWGEDSGAEVLVTRVIHDFIDNDLPSNPVTLTAGKTCRHKCFSFANVKLSKIDPKVQICCRLWLEHYIRMMRW